MYLHIFVHLYDPKYSVRFYIVPKRATADCGPQPVRRAATGNIYACSPTSDQRRTWIYVFICAYMYRVWYACRRHYLSALACARCHRIGGVSERERCVSAASGRRLPHVTTIWFNYQHFQEQISISQNRPVLNGPPHPSHFDILCLPLHIAWHIKYSDGYLSVFGYLSFRTIRQGSLRWWENQFAWNPAVN